MKDFLGVIIKVASSSTFLTVISGVLVFVLCQLFDEYWLKPIQQYKELRARISYSLTLYANLYMNPVEYKLVNVREEIDNASLELRKLAAEVDSVAELKPFGNFFIANKRTLRKVSENLIGLSNSLYSPHPEVAVLQNDSRRKEIYKLLSVRE